MLLFPTQYVPIEGNLVFLAGPIQGTSDWQALATAYLQAALPDLHIANPRSSREPAAQQNFSYEAQVDWESHHLQRAAQQGVIFFFLSAETEHFPERAFAQTTRFELAEWKTKQLYNPDIKLVIAVESKFSGLRYIRHRIAQDNPQIPILEGLENGCQAVVEMVKRIA